MAEVIKMPGTVRSVNGIKPDANANVELEAKPLFLIKQFRYKLTTEDQAQWKNNYIGNWTLKKGTNFVTIFMNDAVYKGVIVEMNDEAGNAVRCITAAGNNNESIWAVFYKE